MATAKHSLHKKEEPEPKRQKGLSASQPVSPDSQTLSRVVLNPADCNLDFDINGDGIHGHALCDGGFSYCWSGARADVGITGGKYCFGCKVLSFQLVSMEDTPPDQQHLCRVGVSKGDDPVGNLGETSHSFGFGGTGKFSHSGKFLDYGEKFSVGDTIVCAVDLENKSRATIGFSKNGKWLGIASHFNAGQEGLKLANGGTRSYPWESAIFPHCLLKNVEVQMQFSLDDGLLVEEGYKPWNLALEDKNATIGPHFSGPKDCEVLMMVGLPASGKTTWAEKHVREHPEKRYVLLGTNLALEQMKVPGLLRKHNYGERFDKLMNRATNIFNTLLARAAKVRRNYIIDQTNVYKSARKRKLGAFNNHRKIAVVVFPTPVELSHRAEKRFTEMGKEVPAAAVNEMLANYVLPKTNKMPGSDEFFDEVIFTELNREDTEKYLKEMKQTLCAAPDSNILLSSSRESSLQSVNFKREKSEAASVTGGHGRSSYISPAIPNSMYFPPSESTPAYVHGSTYGRPEVLIAGSRCEQGRRYDIYPARREPSIGDSTAVDGAYGRNYPSREGSGYVGGPFHGSQSDYSGSLPYAYDSRSGYGSAPRDNAMLYGRNAGYMPDFRSGGYDPIPGKELYSGYGSGGGRSDSHDRFGREYSPSFSYSGSGAYFRR